MDLIRVKSDHLRHRHKGDFSFLSVPALRNLDYSNTLFIFFKQPLFWLKPLKEIEITTNKLTTMCLKYGQFED